MLLVDDLAAGGTKNLRHTPRGLVTLVRSNRKNSVLRLTSLKILVRVGTHFFYGKSIILCILKSISPFKMQKIVYFSKKKTEKI